MNSDSLTGTGRDLGGKITETAGDATGDRSLQGEGLADQLSGKAQKVVGAARDALNGTGPLVDQAKSFAKARPFATAALAGVIGVALLNTIRGKS